VGDGRLCDEADIVEFRDMMTIIRDRIQAMIEDGMSMEQVVEAGPTRDYDGRYGADSGFWTTRQFVETMTGVEITICYTTNSRSMTYC